MNKSTLLIFSLLLVSNVVTLGAWRTSVAGTEQQPLFKSTLELDAFRNQLHKVQTLGPADIPVEMETREFYTGITEDRKTDFYGPPSNKTNAAWASIQDVGLIRLNADQVRLLGTPTARQYNAPVGSYVGVLEVFHQLHCLSRIRMAFYTEQKGGYWETLEVIERHTDHCFDYLRQSLMCLSDVNIGPVGWNDETKTYIAERDGVKACRNFDKIHEWAKAHDVPDAPGNANPLGHDA
ncbi:hypothetical protein MY4824_009746 [Beauveria thailandica]